MNIVINPGTEPIGNANETEAINNMTAFLADAGIPDATVERTAQQAKHDCGGRFFFDVTGDGVRGGSCEVLMPGLPLEKVRFVGGEDQNIWDFPRLYVGGSSWVWKYAVGMILEDD